MEQRELGTFPRGPMMVKDEHLSRVRIHLMHGLYGETVFLFVFLQS